MAQHLRRAVPRQPADWVGFYRFDDVRNEHWRACRILDISPLGAGVEIFDIQRDAPLEGALSLSLELRGVPRNVILDEDQRSARLGVEFPEVTETAKEYLRRMNGSRTGW